MEVLKNPDTRTTMDGGDEQVDDLMFPVVKFDQLLCDLCIFQKIEFPGHQLWCTPCSRLQIVVIFEIIRVEDLIDRFTSVATESFVLK